MPNPRLLSSFFSLLLGISLPLAAEPSKPMAVSPGDIRAPKTINETCPTFSWAGSEQASGFEIVVWQLAATDTAEPEAVIEQTVIEETLPAGARGWTPSLGQCLTPGKRYAWAVREIQPDRREAWSDPALFDLAAIPTELEFHQALETARRFLDAQAAGPASGPIAASRIETLPSSPVTRVHAKLLATPGTTGFSSKVPATTGVTFGVHGVSNSSGTGSAGVVGQSTAASGDVAGVVGQVASAAGAAGEFDNLAGGDILRGLNNGVEMFSVDGAGAVRISGGLKDADGSGFFDGSCGENERLTAISDTGAITCTANSVAGDNLGNHTATQNLELNGNWLSRDGDSEGILVDAAGNVGVGVASPGDKLDVAGDIDSSGVYRIANAIALSKTGTNIGVGTLATTGSRNFFAGFLAGKDNVSASDSVFIGNDAGKDVTSGSRNVIVGSDAGQRVTTGTDNVLVGDEAGEDIVTGDDNTALGSDALRSATGDENIAIGRLAGANITSGDENICIGNQGAAGDANTIRIGFHHFRTFLAGVRGVTTSTVAIPVLIDSQGQLGTTSSSRRFKTDIRDIGDASSRLHRLRPVSFRYQSQVADKPHRAFSEYGLVAEEVEEVFPELVIYDPEGRPETVRYNLLSSLLLNELQKQQRVIANQGAELEHLKTLLQSHLQPDF